jgi:hypothetical protein
MVRISNALTKLCAANAAKKVKEQEDKDAEEALQIDSVSSLSHEVKLHDSMVCCLANSVPNTANSVITQQRLAMARSFSIQSDGRKTRHRHGEFQVKSHSSFLRGF